MMISLGRGMQALSMVMQKTIPAYPQFEITERTNEVTGLRRVSSKAYGATSAVRRKVRAAAAAAAGIVSTYAHTVRPATPQRTAEGLRVAPTPTIAPVIVCVVDTGMPRWVAVKRLIAPAVSAQNPPTGRRVVTRAPSVCTIRHPPKRVPNAIADPQAKTTHAGTEKWSIRWVVKSRTVMIPIVFCASLAPCPRE